MTHLDKKVFDLKIAVKQIIRNAKKLKKEEEKELHLCWKHVMRGEHDIGRVHAENAIRNNNQSLDLMKLGARLQGSVNVLQGAIIQQSVTSAMRSIVFSMASATRNMNLPSLTMTMNKFERMTDHLSARQDYVSESLAGNGGNLPSSDQVELLMAKIIDRVGLDVKNEMPSAVVDQQQGSLTPHQLQLSSANILAETKLDEKLAKLRHNYNL